MGERTGTCDRDKRDGADGKERESESESASESESEGGREREGGGIHEAQGRVRARRPAAVRPTRAERGGSRPGVVGEG